MPTKLDCPHKLTYILRDRAVCIRCGDELELTEKYQRSLSIAYKWEDKYLPIYRLRGGRG